MRQIWITKAGPPEVLQLKEAPDPEPKAGEVRIRVEASGINFADILGRLGLYPDLPPIPVVPGYEVGGRIDALGAGVDASWAGRDVFALTRFGGYADVVCVPLAQVFERPDEHVGTGRRRDSGQLFHRLAALSSSWAVSSAARPFSFIPWAAASALPRRRSPSISAPLSSGRRLPQSTPRCARLASIISSTTGPRILKRARARSPRAAVSNLFSMPSAANPGRRAIAFLRRPAGSGCSAFPRQPAGRSATFSGC